MIYMLKIYPNMMADWISSLLSLEDIVIGTLYQIGSIMKPKLYIENLAFFGLSNTVRCCFICEIEKWTLGSLSIHIKGYPSKIVSYCSPYIRRYIYRYDPQTDTLFSMSNIEME